MNFNDPLIVNLLYFSTGMCAMVLLEHVILEPLFRTRDKVELSKVFNNLDDFNSSLIEYWDSCLSYTEDPSYLPLTDQGKKELLDYFKRKKANISFWQSILRGIPEGRIYYCGVPIRKI